MEVADILAGHGPRVPVYPVASPRGAELRYAGRMETPKGGFSRPMPDQLRSNRQDFLRRAARDLLRALDGVAGPDEPETRETLRDVAAAIEARREDWPPE